MTRQFNGSAADIASPRNGRAHTRDIAYVIDGATYTGYLAQAEAKSKRPGILVCHQGGGLTDDAKERARTLAGEGYVAFALDMNGKVAKNMQEAMAWPNALVARWHVRWMEFPASSRFILVSRADREGAREVRAKVMVCAAGPRRARCSMNASARCRHAFSLSRGMIAGARVGETSPRYIRG